MRDGPGEISFLDPIAPLVMTFLTAEHQSAQKARFG
jgi:hypothetical protein